MDIANKQREELLAKLFLMKRLRFISAFCIMLWGLFLWFFQINGFEALSFFLLISFEMFINQPYIFFIKRIRNIGLLLSLHQIFDVVVITTGIYFLGGTNAYFGAIIYSLIIIFVGVVISVKSTFVTATLCSLGYLSLFILENLKILPRKPILDFNVPVPLNFLILGFICLSLFLIAYVTSFLIKIIIKKTEESNEYLDKMKQAENAMIQAEKLAVVGQFATGVVHEVKNPLGVILSGMEFLEAEIQGRACELIEPINKIKQSALRADEIIKDLLNFARPSGQQLLDLDLNEVVADNIKLLKEVSVRNNIQIIKELSKNPINVKINASQFGQVVFNIIINACEAMPNSGKILVRSYHQEYAQKGIKSGFRESSNFVFGQNVAVLEVQDEGMGIPQENISKIFDPFFTTKQKKENTGLGLAICRRIIDAHKGEIEIKSMPQKGTIVVIRLPLVNANFRESRPVAGI